MAEEIKNDLTNEEIVAQFPDLHLFLFDRHFRQVVSQGLGLIRCSIFGVETSAIAFVRPLSDDKDSDFVDVAPILIFCDNPLIMEHIKTADDERVGHGKDN